jgi:uncharacterized SAM-binding protein YcdF (DUF218 family)
MAFSEVSERAAGARSPRRQRRRPWVRAGAVLVAGALVYVAVNAFVVWRASTLDQARPVQAILVLGSAEYNGVPSPDLEARLAHALDLWRRGLAPVIVVTGGKEAGDVDTEAGASAAWLAARGVPQRAMLREVSGRNTWQSLDAAAACLLPRGIRRVLLVSDPYHDDRIACIAGALGLEAYVSPTRTSPIQGGAVIPYFAKEVAEVSVGRLIGFRNLGRLEDLIGL